MTCVSYECSTGYHEENKKERRKERKQERRYVQLGLLFALTRIVCSPVELDRKIVAKGEKERVTYLCIFILLILMHCLFVCLFSWRYNPLWLCFHSPVAGFSFFVF